MKILKSTSTRFPSLTRAVVRQTGRENLEEIARHGADGGFSGFTYARECVAFFKRNRKDIMAMAEQDAQEFGQGVLEMIASFGCLKSSKLSAYDISQSLEGRGDDADTVQNAMAWFAAEEVARELNPDV